MTTADAQIADWTRFQSANLPGYARVECEYTSRGKNAAMDAAGNVFVTGQNFDDMVVMKFNGDTGALLWTRTYNGSANSTDCGAAIAVDASGNAFVTGTVTEIDQGKNILVAKYAGDDGSLLWRVSYNGTTSRDDRGIAIAVDPDGHAIVAGASADFTAQTFFDSFRVIKFDGQTGIQLWTYAVTNGGRAEAVNVDASGAIYASGRLYHGPGTSAGHLVKLAAATGQLIWSAFDSTMGGPDNIASMSLDSSGNVIVAGSTPANVQPNQVPGTITTKYAGIDGTKIWSVTQAALGVYVSSQPSLTIDYSGNPIVTTFDSMPTGSPGHRTTKYLAATGMQVWSTNFETGPDYGSPPFSIGIDSSDSVVITGSFVDGQTTRGVSVVRYNNTTGDAIWSKLLPDSSEYYYGGSGKAVLVTPDGELVIVGTSIVEATNGVSIRAIKFKDSDGTVVWDAENRLSEVETMASSVAVDAGGNVFAAGKVGTMYYGHSYSRSAKYDPTGALLWVADTLPEMYSGNGNGIAVDTAGNAIEVMQTAGGSIRAIKRNGATGNVIWDVDALANSSTLGKTMVLDTAGDIYLLVSRSGANQSLSIGIMKLSGSTGGHTLADHSGFRRSPILSCIVLRTRCRR